MSSNKMEPVDHTSCLPIELTLEIIRFMDWKQLYQAYQGTGALKRIPTDHRIWQELHKRYISSYEPPSDNYRDYYFAAQQEVERLRRLSLEDQVVALAKLGYDVALRAIIGPELYRDNPVIREIMYAAADGGYVTILEMLERYLSEEDEESIFAEGISGNQIPVMEYGAKLLGGFDSQQIVSHLAYAIVHGHPEPIEWMLNYAASESLSVCRLYELMLEQRRDEEAVDYMRRLCEGE